MRSIIAEMGEMAAEQDARDEWYIRKHHDHPPREWSSIHWRRFERLKSHLHDLAADIVSLRVVGGIMTVCCYDAMECRRVIDEL